MEADFDSGFFTHNRQKLKEALGKDIPIVIAAHGLLQKSRDEAYPFRQESNFWYLTGIDQPDFTLVIDGDGEYLIAPERSEYLDIFSGEVDEAKIKETSGVEEVLDAKAGWRKLGARLKKSKTVATLEPLPEYIEQLGLYTNPAGRNLADKLKEHNKNLELAGLRTYLSQLRSIKADGELRCIRRATNESVKLHREIAANLSEFKSEQDVVAFIKKHAIDNRLEPSYEPIAASGKNAAVLHYENGQDRLKPAEPLLVDAAFAYLGYRSDITRTYCLKPTKRHQQIQEAVITVQKQAIEMIKPGVLLDEYEESVRGLMGKQLKKLGLMKAQSKGAVEKYYPHRTSHFLGLDAHDPGDPDKPLQVGMVLTVEPGIYVPQEAIGVRIEDTVAVTEKGNEVLSGKLPKLGGVS